MKYMVNGKKYQITMYLPKLVVKIQILLQFIPSSSNTNFQHEKYNTASPTFKVWGELNLSKYDVVEHIAATRVATA